MLMLLAALVFEVIMFSLALFPKYEACGWMETEAALRAEIKATQDILVGSN